MSDKQSDKINVMIVEDQAMPRQLFEAIVRSEEKLNLAVSVENAEIADICCARHGVDLVLMDVVTKNGASGLVAAEKIKEENKKIKIIIVTSMPEYSYVERAKKIGVEGFWQRTRTFGYKQGACGRNGLSRRKTGSNLGACNGQRFYGARAENSARNDGRLYQRGDSR